MSLRELIKSVSDDTSALDFINEYKNQDDEMPFLLSATECGNRFFVKFLLNHGHNVDTTNTHGQTALTFAVLRNNEKLVKLLLKWGADVNHVGRNKNSPLILAIQHSKIEIIEMLLNHGANIHHKNCYGNNSLTIANSYLNKMENYYGSKRVQTNKNTHYGDVVDLLNKYSHKKDGGKRVKPN